MKNSVTKYFYTFSNVNNDRTRDFQKRLITDHLFDSSLLDMGAKKSASTGCQCNQRSLNLLNKQKDTVTDIKCIYVVTHIVCVFYVFISRCYDVVTTQQIRYVEIY